MEGRRSVEADANAGRFFIANDSQGLSQVRPNNVTFCEVVFVIFAVDHLKRAQPVVQQIELN